MLTPTNPKLCVTLHRQNAHLFRVNPGFASVASLDFGIISSPLIFPFSYSVTQLFSY
jgi:hypothetical protein